jgi:Icc-related predicted phosphoesterase
MKILAVSDYIDPDLAASPGSGRSAGVELILSCGDLPPEYLASLAAAYRAPLYYVRGNHDIRVGSSPCAACLDIHGGVYAFGGLTILGLQGSHWYNGGPLQYRESEMRLLVRRARTRLRRFGRLDVVVTHAAPRGIGDGPDMCHRGFQCFRRLIDRLQPRVFFHGHLHHPYASPEERVSVVGKTQVINCSGHYLLELDDAPPPV